MTSAVFQIIEGFFFTYVETLNFVTADRGVKLNDFKDELLNVPVASCNGVILQEDVSKLTVLPEFKRRNLIIMIESFEDFYKVYQKMTSDLFYFNGRYLIILVDGLIQEIEEIFQLLWKLQVHNVLILYEATDGSVPVKTFVPFTSQNCNDTTPVTINIFKGDKFEKDKRNLFRNKLRNLNNCTIRVTLGSNTDPFVLVKSLPNGNFELKGSDIQLLNALSQSLNFRSDFVYIGSEGYFWKNGTSEGPLLYLLNGEADLSITYWWLKISRLKFLDATSPYASDQIVFVVPPGRELNAIEKLIFPFKYNLWILIFGCLLIGYIVIFLVKRCSELIRNFVFGSGVVNPYLNMFIAFVGGSQNILPKRNFARFLLMMFLMYSLIIRTLYQGSFYNLMRSHRRMKEVQTFEEMIDKDYQFYMYKGNVDILQASPKLGSRVVSYEVGEQQKYYLEKIGSNPTAKGAYGMSLLSVLYKNQNLSEESRFKTCNDVLFNAPVVIYTRKNFFLLDALNEKIQIFKAAGLIRFWQLQEVDENLLKTKESNYLEALTLKHLVGSAYILFIGYFSSLMAFAYEKWKRK